MISNLLISLSERYQLYLVISIVAYSENVTSFGKMYLSKYQFNQFIQVKGAKRRKDKSRNMHIYTIYIIYLLELYIIFLSKKVSYFIQVHTQ